MLRPASGCSDTPGTPLSVESPRQPSVPYEKRGVRRQLTPPSGNEWNEKVLGRRQKILDDLSVATAADQYTRPANSSTPPLLASRGNSFSASGSPPFGGSFGSGSFGVTSPIRKPDGEFMRVKAPIALRPLTQALSFGENDEKTERLLEKADEADLVLESATEELEAMKEEFVELRASLDFASRNQELDDPLEAVKERSVSAKSADLEASGVWEEEDEHTQAKHDLIREELIRMRLSLMKQPAAESPAKALVQPTVNTDPRQDTDSPSGHSGSSTPGMSSARSSTSQPFKRTSDEMKPSPPSARGASFRRGPASPRSARAQRHGSSSSTGAPSGANPLSPQGPPELRTAFSNESVPESRPGSTRPSTSLVQELMSNWRPVTAPTKTAQTDRFNPGEKELYSLITGMRSLGAAPADWPSAISNLYARMNFCMAQRNWDGILEVMLEGMRVTHDDVPASVFLSTYDDVLCVLSTTFGQESIGALYWVHLFKALNSVVAHLVGQSGEAVQELRKTVDAKQRALFDSDFVEAVFDNFGDVALRRAAQTLIGNLTGLVVQRAHMDPDEWDLKCQTAFARHELAMQHNAADVAVLPDRHKVWLWSKEDVADWLCYHGFAEYCKVFKDHEVDGHTLLNLSIGDLERLAQDLAKLRLPSVSVNTLCLEDGEAAALPFPGKNTPGVAPATITTSSSAGWFAPAPGTAFAALPRSATTPSEPLRKARGVEVPDDFEGFADDVLLQWGGPEKLRAPLSLRTSGAYRALLICADTRPPHQTQCETYVEALYHELSRRGVGTIRALCGAQATRTAVVDLLQAMSGNLRPGETVLVWYLGCSGMEDGPEERKWVLQTDDSHVGEDAVPHPQGHLCWQHFQPLVKAVKAKPKDSGTHVLCVFDTYGHSVSFPRAGVDRKNNAARFIPQQISSTSSVQVLCNNISRQRRERPVEYCTPLFTASLAKEAGATPLHVVMKRMVCDWQSQGHDRHKQLQLIRLLGEGDLVFAAPPSA